jgi:dihydroorotate dehydrogenase electron transfer subunit
VCLAWIDHPAQPFLRLPLHIYRRPDAGLVFYLPVGHPYTRLSPGDMLNLIGPVGRGFHLPRPGGHLLVVAGAVERLMPTIDAALHQGLAVTALTPRSAELLPSDVEVHRGPMTAELAAWADVVALDVADPRARAQHIRSLGHARGQGYVQALLTPTMPCGTGACQVCWVELAQPHVRKLACVDGPVFYF